MNRRVLFVDDEANLLFGMQRQFHNRYEVSIAQGPKTGIEMIRRMEPYAVVVADMRMPHMNGIEFLAETMRLAPDTVRIMLTGQADQQTAMDAVNHGQIFRFLNKPCPPEKLALAIDAGIEQHRLITAETELLRNTLTGSVRVLTELLASSSPETYARNQKLKQYCKAVGNLLQLKNPWELELAAMLCGIGRMAVPSEIVAKCDSNRDLTEQEREIWERTPGIAHDLLNNIPRMEPIAKIILYHHKCYSGSGFPNDNLSGEDIPIESRIIKALMDFIELENANSSRTVAYRMMLMRYGWYDPMVTDAIEKTLISNKPPKEEDLDFIPDSKMVDNIAEAMEHGYVEKEVHELFVGDILYYDLHLLDGKMILPRGATITNVLLEKIMNYHRLKGVQEPIQIAL